MEIVRKIGIDHLASPMLFGMKEHLTNGHLRVQSRPKAVLATRKVGFEDRTQDQMDSHLDDPVPVLTTW